MIEDTPTTTYTPHHATIPSDMYYLQYINCIELKNEGDKK